MKEKIVRLVFGIVLFLVGGVLLFTGILLLVASLYHYLEPMWGKACSFLAIGSATVVMAFLLFFIGHALNKTDKQEGGNSLERTDTEEDLAGSQKSAGRVHREGQPVADR